MAAGTIRRIPLPPAVLNGGRQVFRKYGAATAGMRPEPDFLIIGAKRGSTTSAYFQLLEHPNVLPLFPSARFVPKRRDGKGPHYFDTNFDQGRRWYLGHFPSRFTRHRAARRLGSPVVTGESSPYYLFHPLAAERAAAMVPNAKILLWLRDPVIRTYSAWKLQQRNGFETLDFADALAAEPGRTAGEEERIIAEPGYNSFAHEFQTYRAQSEYARPLSRWLKHFPSEQVKVVVSEEYHADAPSVCADVFRFLGLPPHQLSAAPVLNAAVRSPMPEDVRAELVSYFSPHNSELEQMIGRQLPWPKD